MRDALLVSRAGTAPRRRSLDLVLAALSPIERSQLDREVELLAARGVRAAPVDGRGPLFYTGPYERIGATVLAVCGRWEAGAAQVRLAEHAARTATAAGATVIAGDVDGPQRAAIRAALEAGGLAVMVRADGPVGRPVDGPSRGRTHRQPGGRDGTALRTGTHGVAGAHGGRGAVAVLPAARSAPMDAGQATDRLMTDPLVTDRLVTVSPCAPGQPWSVDAAMACNATIAEMCTALVAVDAGSTGATLDAGMRALAAGRPVVAVGATRGSRLLVDHGATAAADELELTWWLNTRLRAAARATATAAARPDHSPSWQPSTRRWSTA